MKNILVGVLAIATVGLGAWCVSLRGKLQAQAGQVAQLEKTRSELAAARAELKQEADEITHAKFAEANANIMQKTLKEETASAVEQSKKAEQLQQSLAAARTNNPIRAMTAMFKDPKMREMMKSQQKAVLGPLLDKRYKELFSQLGLSAEQGAAVKDLLMKKMLASSDSGFALLDDSLTAEQRAEVAKQIKTQAEGYDNQIKQILGDQNYAQFESYEKTADTRDAVGQINDQLGANAMSAEQQQQLIQAVMDTRDNFKWTTPFGAGGNTVPDNGDVTAMFSGKNLDQFANDLEQYDQEVAGRAQQFLTATQMAGLEDYLKSRRQATLLGMKMAAQLFVPQKTQ